MHTYLNFVQSKIFNLKYTKIITCIDYSVEHASTGVRLRMEDRHVDLEFLGAWAINSQKTSIAADTSYQTDWWTIDDNKIAGYVHYYKYSGGRWERLHTLYVTIEKTRWPATAESH